jgi:hypothetical protein
MGVALAGHLVSGIVLSILMLLHREELLVREYKGWVRNVALIKRTLGPGKPKGGWNFGREGTGGQMGNKGS